MTPGSSEATLPYAFRKMPINPPSTESALYASLPILDRTVIHIPDSNLITVCGGLAGAASAIVSCPLDVIKTKLQAQGGFRGKSEEPGLVRAKVYRGIRGTAKVIWTEEGVRGFYRGLGPLLLGYVPTWAVYLTVYNKTQLFFDSRTGKRILSG